VDQGQRSKPRQSAQIAGIAAGQQSRPVQHRWPARNRISQQSAIIDQLASVDLQLQQIISAQRDLVDKVNVSQQTVAGLQSGLANRVKDNEQAVAAIDAYRLQLNTRLATIERRLNNLASSQLSDL
jgi:hypothetical protein